MHSPYIGYIFALSNKETMAKEKIKKLIDVKRETVARIKKKAFEKDTSVKKIIEQWVEEAANKED